MRVAGAVIALSITVVLVACGHKGGGGEGTDGGSLPADATACVGLQCKVVNCAAQQKAATSISGTVYAPNGVLPRYGISVYVPNRDPGPLVDKTTCARCTDALPGDPIVQTVSDELGHFSLSGIPAGDNIPVVITTGKWRRQLVIPHIDACAPHALATTDTRLPANRSEGDIPRIAITTGLADSLECLIRKLGISDSEITTATGGGRVHLYAGEGGENRFKDGSGTFAPATTLWNDLEKMKQYDIVMFSCEGASFPEDKSQAARDAVKAYTDLGGRLFASHWHNIWIEGAHNENGMTQRPAVWASDGANEKGIADWSNNDQELDAHSHSLIDELSNPKGQSFATWMINVGGSAMRDRIDLQDQSADLSTGRSTCSAVHPDRAERWVYLPELPGRPDQSGGAQNFQFTTPNEQADESLRCGKVVFSDMHVSGTSGADSNGDGTVDVFYPDNCKTIPGQDPNNPTALTPQEKALAFMFFDISSCVGTLF